MGARIPDWLQPQNSAGEVTARYTPDIVLFKGLQARKFQKHIVAPPGPKTLARWKNTTIIALIEVGTCQDHDFERTLVTKTEQHTLAQHLANQGWQVERAIIINRGCF